MVADFREQLARQRETITRMREMIQAFRACMRDLLVDRTNPLVIAQARYLIARADKLEQELAAQYLQTERR
jgi:hypothetical protein